jgi:DNA-binding NarL/FixJ family response regulator
VSEALDAVPEPTVTPADPLSRRQREVAVLVSRGLTNREIADALVLSERIVDAHVDNIRGKLGVRSRTQIAAWVLSR